MFRRLLGTAVLAAVLSWAGCFGPQRGPAPPPPALADAPAHDNEQRAESAVFPPVIPIPEPAASAPPTDNGVAADGAGVRVSQASPASPPEPEVAEPSPAAATPQGPADAAMPSMRDTAPSAGAPPPPQTETSKDAGGKTREPATPAAAEGAPAPVAKAPKPSKEAAPKETGPVAREALPEVPGWAESREVLEYRVDFIGITMGYARFTYRGKVSIGGQVAYHLSVRAWTTGVLSHIYPINDTIDYYLDVGTLAPIRQEFTERTREKDDVLLYNQETGRITYRYRQSGEIRKQVNTVPGIYDPVSAVYYFRWKDLGEEQRPRNVYAGRKVWQISARVLGSERLRTPRGEVDTLVVQPVIRREGKLEDKGELKMWVSNDARRVPVRLFAKFHKILDWTLLGELLPAQKRG